MVKPWPHGHVVPPGWAAHHRPVVAGFLNCRATLTRRTGRTVVDVLGTEGDTWATLGTNLPALVQSTNTMADVRDASGRPIVVAEYLGRLEVEWLPETGDRLTVTTSEDPALLGVYVVRRREAQGHVVDRTVHLDRITSDTD